MHTLVVCQARAQRNARPSHVRVGADVDAVGGELRRRDLPDGRIIPVERRAVGRDCPRAVRAVAVRRIDGSEIIVEEPVEGGHAGECKVSALAHCSPTIRHYPLMELHPQFAPTDWKEKPFGPSVEFQVPAYRVPEGEQLTQV